MSSLVSGRKKKSKADAQQMANNIDAVNSPKSDNGSVDNDNVSIASPSNDNNNAGGKSPSSTSHEEAIKKIFEEFKRVQPLYATYSVKYGMEALREALINRSVTIGVISALIGSMIFPLIVEPPLDDLDRNAYFHLSQGCYIIALSLAFINVAVSAFRGALYGTNLASDEHLIQFLNNLGMAVIFPEVLTAMQTMLLLIGALFQVYGISGRELGIFYLVIIYFSFLVILLTQFNEVAFAMKTSKLHVTSTLNLTNEDAHTDYASGNKNKYIAIGVLTLLFAGIGALLVVFE